MMWRKEEVEGKHSRVQSADCWAGQAPALLCSLPRRAGGACCCSVWLAQTRYGRHGSWQARVRVSPVAHSLPPTSFSGKPEGGGTGAARALPAPDGKKGGESWPAIRPPGGWNHAVCST